MDMVESDGWIFVEKGNGYAGVRFLDSGYEWNENEDLAIPKDYDFGRSDSRFIFITGDSENHGDFEKFQEKVITTSIETRPDLIKIRGGISGGKIDFYPYDPKKAADFILPKIDGEPINLRPQQTFWSPYLRSEFGNGRISVKVGPISQVYDFEKSKIE